jgi:hypothetical protein
LIDPEGDGDSDPRNGRFAASRIPGATVVQVLDAGGLDGLQWYGRGDGIVKEVGRFMRDLIDDEARFDRVLATVLFTDIVDSTYTSAELGDRRWRELLERHHAVVRALLSRYRGREVDPRATGSSLTSTVQRGAFAARRRSSTPCGRSASRSGRACTPVRSRRSTTRSAGSR